MYGRNCDEEIFLFRNPLGIRGYLDENSSATQETEEVEERLSDRGEPGDFLDERAPDAVGKHVPTVHRPYCGSVFQVGWIKDI